MVLKTDHPFHIGLARAAAGPSNPLFLVVHWTSGLGSGPYPHAIQPKPRMILLALVQCL